MIQGFRNFVDSIVGKAFFFVIMVTFALLGVGYGIQDLIFRTTKATDAAKVGDTTVSIQELDRQFRVQLQNMQRQMGGSFTPTPAQKQELARATLEQQVVEAIYAEAARDSNLRIGDDLVRRKIQEQPSLFDENKKFDMSRFKMFLQSQGLTEQGFVAMVKQDLARQLLITPVAGSALAPKALVNDMYRYRNEQRVAETVYLADTMATGLTAPSEADLKAYYDKHSVDFTLPEYRTVTVLPLTLDLFMGDINPTEDELKAAYEVHKSEYVQAEKRKIQQVVVNDKATADAISKATTEGKSLADAAKAATAGKAQPVAFELMAKEDFPPALQEPVFAAAKGAIVGPIESPLGWHVFQVEDIQAGTTIPYEEAKPKLVEQLKKEGAADRLAEQIDKLGDRLMGGNKMEDIATAVNAKIVKFGPSDAKGRFPPNAQAPDVPNFDPAWLTAAFRLQSGETSPFQEGADGGYFAVRLDSITPPALRPFDEVKADVVTRVAAEQKAAATKKQAEALVAKAKSGTKMADIATETKTKVETTPPLMRDISRSLDTALPQAVIDGIFAIDKVGDVVSIAVPGGEFIARLSEIRAADPAKDAAALEPIAREMDGGLRADQIAEYRAALRDKFKPTLNPTAVETVAGQ